MPPTGGRGCDVILDAQAGPSVGQHLDLLDFDGRLILIASHAAPTTEVDTRALVRRRLTLAGSTLRPRDAAYKGRLAEVLVREVWPLLASGAIRLDICATFAFDAMADAHRLLDENRADRQGRGARPRLSRGARPAGPPGSA